MRIGDDFMCMDAYLWLFVIILCAWMSICDYFVKIYKNYANLCKFMWIYGQETLQKPKERYSKEKAAVYYAQNKEAIKEKSREHFKILTQEEKDKIKEYQRKMYQELVQWLRSIKEKSIKNWYITKKKR